MKIIIEGVDGAGKTTLAKILANKYELDICHCTQHDGRDYDFYRQTLKKDNVVWDRHTIGELIYPHIFKRKPGLGVEDARLVMHYAKEENVKVLVLTTNLDTIRERLNCRRIPEHTAIMENLGWIDEQFRFYAREFNLPLIDTSKMTLQEIFDLVEDRQIA